MQENKKEEIKTDVAGDASADLPENRLDQLKSLVESVRHNLDKITRIIDKIEQDQRKEMYKKMPGIEGEFDGLYLVADDGSKHEVPANYAAKSRLVFGDKLKIVEENGKKVFKQIQKVERKEVKGVLSKKEGKWYLLTDLGTYKISDVAAEFNQVKLNEKAVGLIPQDKTNVPYAALDRMDSPANVKLDDSVKDSVKVEQKVKIEPKKVEVHAEAQVKKEKTGIKDFVKPKPFQKAPAVKKPMPVKPAGDSYQKDSKQKTYSPGKTNINTVEKSKESQKAGDNGNKEYVAGILEDDDLR